MRHKNEKICCIKSQKMCYKKTTCDKFFLHNLHGQVYGFHSFIFGLNSPRLVWHNFQGLKKVKVSVPFYTISTLHLLNSVFSEVIMLRIFHEDFLYKRW